MAAPLAHNGVSVSATAHSLTGELALDVERARSGDRDAFGRVVGRCSGTVSAIALAILRDPQASEDVSQEVFLKAWAGLRELRNPASFLPWIRQMTRNRARTWLRDQKRKRIVREHTEDLLASAAEPGLDAPAALVAAQDRRVVGEVIEALPDDAREVVTLFYREGKSTKQVAALLGIREEAVRQRLSRARSRLRSELMERFGDVAARTAPGVAFTTAVVGSLGASSTASAMTMGSAVGAAAGKSASAALATWLATAGPGALTVFLGMRKFRSTSIDARERRQLAWFTAAACLTMLVVAAGFTASGVLDSGRLGAATHVFFSLAMLGLYFVWLPRILARRMALEREDDPAAARRQARARRAGVLSFLFGWTIGTATVIWAVSRVGW
jgi:RNA polymerase sigma factor (sigma-70 family)